MSDIRYTRGTKVQWDNVWAGRVVREGDPATRKQLVHEGVVCGPIGDAYYTSVQLAGESKPQIIRTSRLRVSTHTPPLARPIAVA